MYIELVASSAADPDVYGGASIAQLENWKEGKGYWEEGQTGEQGAMQICDWREVTVLLACHCPLVRANAGKRPAAPSQAIVTSLLAAPDPSEAAGDAGIGSGPLSVLGMLCGYGVGPGIIRATSGSGGAGFVK
jgi:hypothetical protein